MYVLVGLKLPCYNYKPYPVAANSSEKLNNDLAAFHLYYTAKV
jgi:hypothetical protein